MGKIEEKVAALNAIWRAPTLQSADPAPFAWTFTAEQAVEAWASGAPVLHFAAAVAAREVKWPIWAERFLTARQDLEATLQEFWAAANAVRPVVSGLGSANPGLTRSGRARRLPEYDNDLVAVLVLKAKADSRGQLDGVPRVIPEGVAALEVSWSSKSALAGLGGSTSNAGGCQGAIVTADWGRAAALLAALTEAESLLGRAKAYPTTLPSVTMTDASAYMKALERAWCPNVLEFVAAGDALRRQTMSKKDTRCVSQYSAMEYIAE
jgi:hypothetical protein